MDINHLVEGKGDRGQRREVECHWRQAPTRFPSHPEILY